MENIFKSWVTTLFGISLWGLAIYEKIEGDIEMWQAGLIVACGFAMIWMRDAISGWITELVKNILNKNK